MRSIYKAEGFIRQCFSFIHKSDVSIKLAHTINSNIGDVTLMYCQKFSYYCALLLEVLSLIGSHPL